MRKENAPFKLAAEGLPVNMRSSIYAGDSKVLSATGNGYPYRFSQHFASGFCMDVESCLLYMVIDVQDGTTTRLPRSISAMEGVSIEVVVTVRV